METTPLKSRHHHTTSGVTLQLLHGAALSNQPPAGTSQNPPRASRTEQGREIQEKHSILLISIFLALDRKARAQLWSWHASVSHVGGWHRDLSSEQDMSSLYISFLNWIKTLNNIITSLWLIHTHPWCVIASDYTLSSHNSHLHFAIAWVFKSTKSSHKRVSFPPALKHL